MTRMKKQKPEPASERQSQNLHQGYETGPYLLRLLLHSAATRHAQLCPLLF